MRLVGCGGDVVRQRQRGDVVVGRSGPMSTVVNMFLLGLKIDVYRFEMLLSRNKISSPTPWLVKVIGFIHIEIFREPHHPLSPFYSYHLLFFQN
ncbi:hypothetical protein L1887_28544 [Cichorium endivia]|nr:hypothetical protein L1887_28544 [Cichorium endivia]